MGEIILNSYSLEGTKSCVSFMMYNDTLEYCYSYIFMHVWSGLCAKYVGLSTIFKVSAVCQVFNTYFSCFA